MVEGSNGNLNKDGRIDGCARGKINGFVGELINDWIDK